MLKRFNPATIAAPASNYVHGVEVPPDARWLSISGQIGARADGSIGQGFEEQAEIAWDNLLVILKEAGMGPEDVVKVTTFLTSPADVAANRVIRDKKLGGVKASSTLLIVAGLASPAFLFEVEATAAKSFSRTDAVATREV
jgi:enamine deaminase RidA (YjgF/YER057c/UK114 family)